MEKYESNAKFPKAPLWKQSAMRRRTLSLYSNKVGYMLSRIRRQSRNRRNTGEFCG
jgi:Cft2 family RNA processing exonuclease